jgi:patatin-like phospholipase/acyl hydrolase
MGKKIRILSFDGGGIRGIIPATIIEYIENRIKQQTGDKNAVIQDYFDMIAGTSTGGILACFYLHQSRLPAKDAVWLYVNDGKKIFNPKGGSFLNKILKYVTAKYSSKGIETVLNDTFKDAKLSQAGTYSLITAYDIVNRKSVFFTVPDAKARPSEKDFHLKDIARATSAAPTYFKPASIKSIGNDELHHLVDGAMFANNPSLCAIVEARKTKFSQCPEPTIKDIYLLSIGTGKESHTLDPKKASRWGILDWAVPVVDILMTASPEIVNYQLTQLFNVAGCSDCYVRLEPGLLNANHAMDDASDENIKNLADAGKNFVDNNLDKLNNIVDTIIESH